MAHVDGVSETIREPWGVVMEMPVTQFFNLMAYRKDKADKERRDIEQWRRTH